MYDDILLSISKIEGKITNKDINNIYKLMPKDDDKFIKICDKLVKQDKWKIFYLVIGMIKKKGALYELKYFNLYENWLYNYIKSWGSCDIYCYRVLNPMIDKYPELYNNVLGWINQDKIYVKRAAPVSFIQSINHTVIVNFKPVIYGFRVNQDYRRIKEICDLLKNDKHPHIEKAIGWLLKYAYISYPSEITKYLKENVNTLSRTTFRYALEKMPNNLRKELMKL